MWVFTSESFVSVVADSRSKEERSDQLIARARFPDDLERFLKDASVIVTPSSDYRFRTRVTRTDLAAALNAAVARIDYGNFKESVSDVRRQKVYSRIRQIMADAQQQILDRDREEPREAR